MSLFGTIKSNSTSTLWSTLFSLVNQNANDQIQLYLRANLPFWNSINQFDTQGFVDWYASAHFMDTEIVFRCLMHVEQIAVLKAWASTPFPVLTMQFDRPTAVASEVFVDNSPPKRSSPSVLP